MKGFVATIKTKLNKAKRAVTAALIGAAAVAYTSAASAAEPDMTAVTSNITTKMGEIVTAALLVLGSVAGAALILFGAIYAWKYGKKVFSVVSR
jgi:hypothetical protein